MWIRTALADDIPTVARIFRRSAMHWPSDRPFLERHPEHLDWKGDGVAAGHTIVAGISAEMLGFATFEPAAVGAWELVDLFVDPDAMGRGVGAALVAAVAARAREEGIARVEVTGNPNALGFYRKVGFEEVGARETEGGPGVRMVLRA